jgi:hypothetical protein
VKVTLVVFDEHESFPIEVENWRLKLGQQTIVNVESQLHAMAFNDEFFGHSCSV